MSTGPDGPHGIPDPTAPSAWSRPPEGTPHGPLSGAADPTTPTAPAPAAPPAPGYAPVSVPPPVPPQPGYAAGPADPGAAPPGQPPSSQVFPGGYPPGAYSGYPPYPGAAPKKSNAGLWVTLGVITVVLLLLVCGGTAALLYQVGNAVEHASTGPSLPPLTLPSGYGEPEHAAPSGKIGEPVTVGAWQFVVTAKPTCKPGPAGAAGKQVTPEDGQFCRIPIKVTNNAAVRSIWLTLSASAYTAKNPMDREIVSLDSTDVTSYEEQFVALDPGKSGMATGVFDIAVGDTIEYVTLSDVGAKGDPVVVDVR
jgi:hypothetical protein